MVQAMETYHSRRIAYSLHDYKKRVAKLLEVRPETYRKQERESYWMGAEILLY